MTRIRLVGLMVCALSVLMVGACSNNPVGRICFIGTDAGTAQETVVASPLAYDVDCPPWVPQFLERATSHKTVRQHLAELQQAGIVDTDVEPLRFASALRDLAGTGVLHFPGLEPPAADGQLSQVLAHWPKISPLPLSSVAGESG